jgi:hypothetical protein
MANCQSKSPKSRKTGEKEKKGQNKATAAFD